MAQITHHRRLLHKHLHRWLSMVSAMEYFHNVWLQPITKHVAMHIPATKSSRELPSWISRFCFVPASLCLSKHLHIPLFALWTNHGFPWTCMLTTMAYQCKLRWHIMVLYRRYKVLISCNCFLISPLNESDRFQVLNVQFDCYTCYSQRHMENRQHRMPGINLPLQKVVKDDGRRILC